ncbi:MAG: ABC transporter substrate-binding protein [Planctomycetota bacterium]
MPEPRVVSLLPSATETIAAVGGAGLLVGVSHECDEPDLRGSLPVLTAPRAEYDPGAGMNAAEVDRVVRAERAADRSLYELDEQALRQLQPDVILTQDLCDVCSIDLARVQRVAASMDPVPTVVSLNPTTLEAVLDDLLKVGHAVGREPEARRVMVDLRGRLFRAQEHVNQFLEGPRVGFMEWTDPIFVAGHWTVQMIERAGATHPAQPTEMKPGSGAAAGPMQAERVAPKSRRIPIELFTSLKPEALVIAPCGLTLDQTRDEAQKLASQDWFRNLPAVREDRVALVDGNQMFNRPGPRLVDAFEWLVGWLNDRLELIPDGFPWEPFESVRT